MKLRFFSLTAAACAVALIGCSEDSSGGRSPGTAATSDAGAAKARAAAPLPEGGFRASLTVANPPTQLAPGETATLIVKIKNTGNVAWPVGGRLGDGFYQVNLGDRWKGADGKEVKIDGRIAMPHAIGPGEEVERPLVVKAPDKPGNYVLEIDMVQEGVSWFAEKGSQLLTLNIKVVK